MNQQLSQIEVPGYLAGRVNQGQADDALLWWAQLTGNEPLDWTDPQRNVILYGHDVARLANATQGLSAVARLLRMTCETSESKVSPCLQGGLAAAVVALVDSMESSLQDITRRDSPKTTNDSTGGAA